MSSPNTRRTAASRPASGRSAAPTMRIPTLTLLLMSLLLTVTTVLAEPTAYAAGRRAFIDHMVAAHGLDRAEVTALMADARFEQRIIDAMNHPFEARPWHAYRSLFLTDERIAGGVAFWNENADLLRRAEAAYGVPAGIIVAIIGIETNYGGRLGDYRALDALSTLGFAYPRRADFFRRELGEFLLLAREEQVDPRTALGSYAGALGKPQFIPSSYRAYAVDFDGDGRRDLWDSNADVIGSVGNYLAQHRWRRGAPIAAPAHLSRGRPGVEIGGGRPLRPNTSVAALRAAGVDVAAELPGSATAALIELAGADGPEYWVTLDNFYAITRYNHSNLYALAVLQLSQAIGTQRSGD